MWMWLFILVVSLISFRVYYRKQSGICRSKRRLDGKTAIVTGGSAGIGKETARDLAKRGAKVILACRDVKKANRIADDIIATTDNGKVYVRQIDTSDLSSVRKFAKEIIDNEPALHILVNNAGMAGASSKKLTSDGLELTMATNHFGHFLLTNMLLDLLKASAPSRIVNVTSEGHRLCMTLDTNDLNYEKRYYPGTFLAYGQSKLSNNLFTLELAEKLRGTGVTANCVHPGAVYTEIVYKEGNKIINFIAACLLKFVGKDEKLGSQTTNYLAVSEEVENISGEYFSECKVSPTSAQAKDHGLAKKLWEVSEKLVNLSQDDLNYKGVKK